MSEPGPLLEIRNRADVAALWEVTGRDVFRWACHLCGGDDPAAVACVVDVYASVAAHAGAGPTASDGPAVVTVDGLRAAVLTSALVHAPDADAVDAVRDHALLSLHAAGRSSREVAAITGVPERDVDAVTARALRSFAADAPGGDVEAVLRARERWLDDDIRAAVATAIGITTTADTADRTHREHRAADVAEPRRRSRRAIVVTLASVVAVLTAAVVWSTAADDADPSAGTGPTATPAASETADTGVSGSTIETLPSNGESPIVVTSGSIDFAVANQFQLPPGSILDRPPDGFVRAGAYEIGDDAGPAMGWYQLWAAPGSSRTSGRWIIVAVSAWRVYDPIAEGAVRVSIGDEVALITTGPSGVLALTTGHDSPDRPTQTKTISITGFGVSADELQQIAMSIEPASRAMSGGIADLQFGTGFATISAGLELLVSAELSCCTASSINPPDGRTSWYAALDGSSQISVTTHDSSVADDVSFRFLVDPVATAAAPGGTHGPISVDGHDVFVGSRPSTDGDDVTNVVQWVNGGDAITITGDVPLTDLLDLVHLTRTASSGEWIRLARAEPPVVENLPVEEAPQPVFAEAGRTRVGRRSLGLSVSPFPAAIRIDDLSRGVQIQDDVGADPLQPVHEYATTDATILVILLDGSPPDLAVRVTVGGVALELQPLVPVDGSTLYAAIVAFEQLPPYTVDLVDATGTVVQSLG